MEDSWVVGLTEGGWSHPGKVKVQNDSFVVFEIQAVSRPYELSRSPDQVRPAVKSDFDRQILDLSKNLIDSEELISKLEGIQQHVPEV
jgi:hypothetical protein